MSNKHFVRRPTPVSCRKPPKPLSPVGMATADDAEELLLFLRVVRGEIEGGHADGDLIDSVARELAARIGGVAFVVWGPRETIEASLGVRFERPLLSRNYYLRTIWNNVIP